MSCFTISSTPEISGGVRWYWRLSSSVAAKCPSRIRLLSVLWIKCVSNSLTWARDGMCDGGGCTPKTPQHCFTSSSGKSASLGFSELAGLRYSRISTRQYAWIARAYFCASVSNTSRQNFSGSNESLSNSSYERSANGLSVLPCRSMGSWGWVLMPSL